METFRTSIQSSFKVSFQVICYIRFSNVVVVVVRSQKQVQQPQPPVPAASYGPPPASSYGPPEEATTTTTEALPTTTEIIEETTTLEPEAENILDADQEVSAKLENPGSYYVVVPQTQKLVASPLVALKSAKLVSTPALPRRVPVQAIPAFAKIQELPQVFETVPYIQTVPLASSSAYINAVNTPFSSSYIQVVQ